MIDGFTMLFKMLKETGYEKSLNIRRKDITDEYKTTILPIFIEMYVLSKKIHI